jgi:hypothetical protein
MIGGVRRNKAHYNQLEVALACAEDRPRAHIDIGPEDYRAAERIRIRAKGIAIANL